MLQALTTGSSPVLLIGIIFVIVAMPIGLVVMLVVRARTQARFRRRLEQFTKAHVAAVPGKRGQRRRLLIQGKLDEIEGGTKKRTERITMMQRFETAGIRITERRFYTFSAMGGLVAFVLPLMFGISLLPSLLFGFAMGLGAPRLVLAYMASKRRTNFLDGFADAVDVIVRGIQSGLPLGECLTIIGRESPEPIAGEFRMMIESTRLGLNLNQAMERAVVRMPVAEFKFFSIVLAIQQETGGNLAETLSNLSGILRDRKQMKDKVKAMSAEARTTAMIIGCLPFVMGGILFLTSPEYIKTLFLHPMGQLMIGGGVVMMATGTAVMAKMIAFKI